MRRSIVKHSAILTALLVLVGYSDSTHAGPVIPLAPGPEVDAFKKAQEALLKKYGVTAESRYVKLKKPQLTVHVLEAGRGEPVLLIHGGGGVAANFAPMMSSLQNEFRIYAPDRSGCGLTDKFDFRETDLREHAVDVITSLMDALELPKATLVGNSMGGLWAMQFALAKPDRVTKLVLLGEPAWSDPKKPTPPPAAKNPTPESIRGFYAARLVAEVKRVPEEFLAVDLAGRRLPGAADSWNTMIEKAVKDKDTFGAYSLRPELKNLRPSMLFIWGDKDKLGSPTLGEEMAKLAPKARCEVLRDAGHLPWLDQPEECNRLVLKFLKEGK
jgi:pimeloyl-ACP methyl ester carboxylesterase